MATKFKKCYETHPDIAVPDTKGVLVGGNCMTPNRIDCDVYIALDGVARVVGPAPWKNKSPICTGYPILDGHAPDNVPDFMLMVQWIGGQLIAGKTVHVGCIGGHGRTGTVLAAVLSQFPEIGSKAAQWVRENYCQKAIETQAQVNFLHKHFGIEKIEPRPHTGAADWGGSGIDWNARYGQPLYDDKGKDAGLEFWGGQKKTGGTKYREGSPGAKEAKQKALEFKARRPDATTIVAPVNKRKSVW